MRWPCVRNRVKYNSVWFLLEWVLYFKLGKKRMAICLKCRSEASTKDGLVKRHPEIQRQGIHWLSWNQLSEWAC